MKLITEIKVNQLLHMFYDYSFIHYKKRIDKQLLGHKSRFPDLFENEEQIIVCAPYISEYIQFDLIKLEYSISIDRFQEELLYSNKIKDIFLESNNIMKRRKILEFSDLIYHFEIKIPEKLLNKQNFKRLSKYFKKNNPVVHKNFNLVTLLINGTSDIARKKVFKILLLLQSLNLIENVEQTLQHEFIKII
jgi:hypothetical protein